MRWTAAAAGLAIVIVVIIVMVEKSDRGPKTWMVRPGEELSLSADEVHADDLYRCQGKGGVNGTPEPGHGVVSGGDFSVETDLGGAVHVACEPGPPGNV